MSVTGNRDCPLEDFRMADGSNAKLLPREIASVNRPTCPRCLKEQDAPLDDEALIICDACACQFWTEADTVEVWRSRECVRDAPPDCTFSGVVY